MKIFNVVVAFVALAVLSACGPTTKIAQLDPNNECPEGEQCVSIVSGGMDAEGGGVVKAGFLIGGNTSVVDKNGEIRVVKNNAQPLVAGINPDRVDVLGNSVIQAGAHLGGIAIQADAQRDIADTQAEATKNAAPGFVLLNQAFGGNSSSSSGASSGSSSGAIAQQATDVKTSQNQGISASPKKIFNPNN